MFPSNLWKNILEASAKKKRKKERKEGFILYG